MSCLSLTSNICRGCRDNAGGIKKVYAANICDITDITHDTTGSDPDHSIISITNTGNWFELIPNKNSSNWTENINASVENGTIFYEQVATLVFGKNIQALRNTVKEICDSDLLLVIEDNNGVYWAIGEIGNGAMVTGGTSASGTAWGDLNGWNLTLTCNSRVPACTVDPTIVAGFISQGNACGC